MSVSPSEAAPASSGRDTTRPLVVTSTLQYYPGWRWFEHEFEDIRWEFFGAKPSNWIEKNVTRPAIASWRACWDSVRTAERERASLLFSQDGRISFRTAQAARIQRAKVPHVAWGFNFTTLPDGLQRRMMSSAYAGIDRFVCYSTMERTLYSEYFQIDPERFDVVLWGVGPPVVESPETPFEPGEYVTAVGGNARDYRCLFAAMERIPHIPLVVVVRPANLAGLRVPPNVRVHVNLPGGRTNNIIAHSRFMALPLVGSQVPCGHVTLVAAMHLGKATVVTDSSGVSDYIRDGDNGLIVPVGDAVAMADAIRRLWEDPARVTSMAENGHRFALEHCSERTIIEHLRRMLTKYGLPA